MSTKTNQTLSQATSRLVDALLQSGSESGGPTSQRFAAMRPGETQEQAQRRVAEVRAKQAAAAQAAANSDKPSWLDWSKLKAVGTVDSVAAAMDTYYKQDRLTRDPGTRARLIDDRQQGVDKEGWTCLASHHDAVNGRGMYLRKLDAGLTVYMSES